MNIVQYRKRPFTANTWDIYHPDYDTYFTKVVAGISWPNKNSGAIVVLGQEMNPHPNATPIVCWFAELETFDMEELLQNALTFKTNFKVQAFYGRIDTSANDVIRQFNQKVIKRGGQGLNIHHPLHLCLDGRLDYHTNVLKNILKDGSKQLTLNPKSCLNNALKELSSSVSPLRDTDYPMVTALAYAVSALCHNYCAPHCCAA